MIWNRNLVFYPYFENFMPLDKPPTLFVILNSILKTANDGVRVPILEVTEKGRQYVFDFDYPLSSAIDKATFEKAWIDHFLQRRIGEETYTAFKLQMRAKFNEIMPYYNPLFDALGEKYDIFAGDGYDITIHEDENTERDIKDVGKSISENKIHNETSGTIDNRYSDTPQNQLSNVKNGTYLTDYTYNQNDGESDTTNNNQTDDSKTTDDDTKRSFDRTENKISNVAKTDALLKYMNETRNLYTAIYHDCDDLFYQLF